MEEEAAVAVEAGPEAAGAAQPGVVAAAEEAVAEALVAGVAWFLP